MQLVWQHQQIGERQAGQHHEEQRGQDPPGPTLVKAGKREVVPLKLADQDAGDEIPADDEEDVDPTYPRRSCGYPRETG